MSAQTEKVQELLHQTDRLRRRLGGAFRDRMVQALYERAEEIAQEVVQVQGRGMRAWEIQLDRVVTHPIWGLPVMGLLLVVVFYLTIRGANVPSEFLAGLLMESGGLGVWVKEYLGLELPAWLCVSVREVLAGAFEAAGAPAWLKGFWVEGVYLAMAWVISVMLPPMAIFFPLFTLLEDLGYLPRMAFNLDGLFRACGAHGKQALTMCMGFGCNAAGVVSCRIIDSPRERLIAILTNAFVPCNGRFPTLILLASVFIAPAMPAAIQGIAAAAVVVLVVVMGVAVSLGVSYVLSRTILRGQPSAFTLELPPYRRPAVLRILYTSLIDRTVLVLMRAMATAAPAGAVIWLLGNIYVGEQSLARHIAEFLQPAGWLMGLDGVILLAYLVAIPANEIVVPTIMMVYLAQSAMTESYLSEPEMLRRVLMEGQGWSMLTAVSLMVFCLLHYPCGTTLWTIRRETGSWRWAALAAAIPLGLGVVVCTVLAAVWRLAARWMGA